MGNGTPHRYHFVSRWSVDAPLDAVYAAI